MFRFLDYSSIASLVISLILLQSASDVRLGWTLSDPKQRSFEQRFRDKTEETSVHHWMKGEFTKRKLEETICYLLENTWFPLNSSFDKSSDVEFASGASDPVTSKESRQNAGAKRAKCVLGAHVKVYLPTTPTGFSWISAVHCM